MTRAFVAGAVVAFVLAGVLQSYLTMIWFVAPGRSVNIYRRPVLRGDPSPTWQHFRSYTDGNFGGEVLTFSTGDEYLVDVPGATMTIVPTAEDDTPTPQPTATATVAPSQTPYIITATPMPTPTLRPLWRVLAPLTLRRR